MNSKTILRILLGTMLIAAILMLLRIYAPACGSGSDMPKCPPSDAAQGVER